MSQVELRMGPQEWLLLFLLSVIWGGSFYFAKVALAQVAPMTLVFFRVLLAAMALLVIIKALHKQIPTSGRLWLAFLLMGVLNNLIPFSLLFWSQTHISSGLAAIFNASVPVFTVLIAHFTTRDEPFSLGKLVGVVLGVLGVVVMIGADLQAEASTQVIWAMLACVAAALSYGVASVYGRRFQRLKVEPLVVAFGQVSASAVVMCLLLWSLGHSLQMQHWNLNTGLSVLALALVSTALAYVIFFRILAKGGATNISLVTLLIPVSAIMLGVLFLDESLASSHVWGMLIIFAGLVAIDGRLWAWLKVRKTGKQKVQTDGKMADLTTGCQS